MLSSILPGFREVRTPLVAGATMLLALYLLGAFDGLASSALGSRLAVLSVQSGSGSIATAAAVTGAYLLGSLIEVSRLSEATLSRLTRFDVFKYDLRSQLQRRRAVRWLVRTRPALWFRREVWSRRKFEPLHAPKDLRHVSDYQNPDVNQWARETIRPLVKQGLRVHDVLVSGAVEYEHESLEDVFLGELGQYLSEEDQEKFYPQFSGVAADRSALYAFAESRLEKELVERVHEDSLTQYVNYRVRNERDRLITRLQIRLEQVYQTFDRQSSEASLRLSLFVPLLVLAAALSRYVGALSLVLVAIGVALVLQGARRQVAADRIVWQALLSGAIEPPVMETVKAALEAKPSTR